MSEHREPLRVEGLRAALREWLRFALPSALLVVTLACGYMTGVALERGLTGAAKWWSVDMVLSGIATGGAGFMAERKERR